jgi:hypothetical protein
MPTGTDTPPRPSSDLIDRFNAIIDDVLACLAVESMKAAGVPWPLRMILAPLLRRRIARWTARFSAIMADVRTGRTVAPAANVAADPVIEDHGEERRCGATSAPRALPSRAGCRERITVRQGAVDASTDVALCEWRVIRPDQVGDVPRVLTDAHCDALVPWSKPLDAWPLRRDGTGRVRKASFFRGGRATDLRMTISLRLVNE